MFLFLAARGFVSEGAGHAEAMCELSDAYWDAVFAFVDRYMEG